MRVAPLVALLAAGIAGCAGPTLEEGDSEFRMGNYHQALEVYREVGDPAQDPALAARIERTEYMVLEDAAVELLHQNRPSEALQVIAAIRDEAPADRELGRLAERCRRLIARNRTEEGFQLLESDRPEDAVLELRTALSWNPDVEDAAVLLRKALERLEEERAAGEELYFRGMEELRAGNEVRARTAFMHASALHGEDSRAATRLRAVTDDLAEESLTLGRLYLRNGLTGPAWLALRDADRLRPGHRETEELLNRVEDRVESSTLLQAADLAVRGGHDERAARLLANAAELDAEGHGLRIERLRERIRVLRNEERYALARAYEMDGQVVHALALYDAILEDETEFGWEDVELRARNLSDRMEDAEEHYRAALRAQEAGDRREYRDHLAECVRLANDYADALDRFLAVEAELSEAEDGAPGAGGRAD